MSGAPDYPVDLTLDFKFTTRAFATGIPTTLAGTPSLEIYRDNVATPITAGITLTVDVNTRTGLNNVRVAATTANGYVAGSNYQIAIAAGTVDGVSVVGEVVQQFSIERSKADVQAWGGSKAAVKNDAGSGLPEFALSAWVTGTVVGSNAITAASIATNAIGADEFAQAAADKVWASSTRTLTGTASANVVSWQGIPQTAVNGKPNVHVSEYASGESPTDALSAIHLDHLLATATPTFPGLSTSIFGEMLERPTTWRYVTEALSQAPSGGGGGTDWTATEREQIRYRLQMDGTQTAPAADVPAQLPVNWATTARTVTGGTVNTVTNVVTADLANDAIKDTTIDATGANKLADFNLRRTAANARAASYTGIDVADFRSLLGAVSKQVNRVAVMGANLNIYQENDTTIFGAQMLTTDAAAEPIVEANTS